MPDAIRMLDPTQLLGWQSKQLGGNQQYLKRQDIIMFQLFTIQYFGIQFFRILLCNEQIKINSPKNNLALVD